MEILRIADTIKARHAGYHDNITAAGKKSRRRTEPQFLDLIVDTQVLFDISIGYRKISLRLIIIIVRHEILYGIVRKERFELTIKLGSKSLVMTQNKGGTLEFLYDVRHCKSLSRSCHTQQCNGINTLIKRITDTLDR